MEQPLSAGRNRRSLMMSLVSVWAGGLVRRRFGGALLIAAAAANRSADAAARTVTEERSVSGFDEVVFAAAGELHIRQGRRESLTVEAEPEILRKITSEVHGKRLLLGFAAGSVIAHEPIRFRLEVRDLHALELRTTGSVHVAKLDTASLVLLLAGSGDIDVGRLTAGKLDVRISGSGTVSVAGGQVDSQRLEIGGAGAVQAKDIVSRSAEVSINGSGDVQLTATARLVARIGGSGSVRYSGNPELTQSITGAGTIERD